LYFFSDTSENLYWMTSRQHLRALQFWFRAEKARFPCKNLDFLGLNRKLRGSQIRREVLQCAFFFEPCKKKLCKYLLIKEEEKQVNKQFVWPEWWSLGRAYAITQPEHKLLFFTQMLISHTLQKKKWKGPPVTFPVIQGRTMDFLTEVHPEKMGPSWA
jgi:hypothetical protein